LKKFYPEYTKIRYQNRLGERSNDTLTAKRLHGTPEGFLRTTHIEGWFMKPQWGFSEPPILKGGSSRFIKYGLYLIQ